jgi:TfoX/Sxy family transcriptional regulator of competence genes
MSQKSIQELEEILNLVTKNLSNVTAKKMFGCYALWANENVFALVWKSGRLGLKLPDTKAYESLMKLTGAEPWKAGPMQMSHWILVPESFHSKTADLKKWAIIAHDQCSKLEKKAAIKKSSSKKGKK